MLYKRIQKLIDDNNYNDIPQCITEFIDNIDNDVYIEAFANMKKNLNVQMAMYRVFVSKELLVKKAFGNEIYTYIEEAINFFYNNDEEKYIDINNSKFINFMREDGQTVIEHFMVNEFYRMLMPFDIKFKNIYDSLIYLCGNYGLIKTLIIGQIYKNGNITKDEMIGIIYKATKSFMHNSTYEEYIIELVKICDLFSLGGLYTLVCN